MQKKNTSCYSFKLFQTPVHVQHRGARDLQAAGTDAEPLLETELLPRPRPPIARKFLNLKYNMFFFEIIMNVLGPETADDDDTNSVPNTPKDHPGVDDGFFPNTTPDDTYFPNTNIGPRVGTDDDADDVTPNGAIPRRRSFPHAPGFAPGFVPPSTVSTCIYANTLKRAFKYIFADDYENSEKTIFKCLLLYALLF